MRTPLLLVSLPMFAAACGSSGKGDGTAPSQSTAPGGFDPPAVAQGFTRLVSPTVPDVKPGDDVTYCQYLMAPFDHDVDVVGVRGFQSEFGHHAAAFTYTPQPGEAVGANLPCMGTEFTAGTGADGGAAGGGSGAMGTFLGAVGGASDATSDGTSSSALPDGVAFRLKQGLGVMLNVHYLNTGLDVIDGNAVVDLKFAEVDPTRKVAAMFLNLNFGFALPPTSPTTSSVDCVAKSDVSIIMMTNHMHDYGTSVSTEVERAGATSFETVHDDPTWTFDMQFNPSYTHWPVDAPFVLHAGDTMRTTCNWNNPTGSSIQFPREMCLGVGFALTTGENPSAPTCVNGYWVDAAAP